MAVNLNFNDVVSNAAQLYITGVANGTIGLPTLVASGAILASAGTSTPPTWANELNLFSGTKTASTPILNLTQTWNNAGVAFTGAKLNVTDTASASGSLLMDLQVGGVSKFNVRKDGSLTVAGQITPGGISPAATGTSISLGNAGFLQFGTGSGGTARGYLDMPSDAVFRLHNGANTITTDITLSVASGSGASTATFGGPLVTLNELRAGNNIQVNATGLLYWASRSFVQSPSNGIVQLSNFGATDFTRLILGTNDASGVAIVKNGTTLRTMLGDGSAYINVEAANGVFSGYVKTQSTKVVGLTDAATAGAGARSFVTDALGPTFGAAVVGGGAVKVPVYSDGTNWLIG